MEWNRKQLDTDLCIIVIVPVLILGIYSVFNRSINEILSNTFINIVLRVLFAGGIFY